MKAESRKIGIFGDVACMHELPQYTPRQENVGKNIELLDIVALTQDIPEYNLRRGEVGTVVEILSNGDALRLSSAMRMDSPMNAAVSALLNSWCCITNRCRHPMGHRQTFGHRLRT